MRSVEFASRSLRVKESQDWQGNRGILQAETTDHTLEEAEKYVKTNYPFFKKYRVRRAEPGFRAYFDTSQFTRSHAHVHDVDSAMDYLQLQENPVMSGSWQHSYSIGYSWHTNENRSSGIAVLYYEDRGMGSDEIIVAAKDRQNLAAAVAVFRDAGVVPQLKKKGVTEATGDNKFDAMMGTMQGNAELLKSVMSEFLTIYYGALDEEDMTDHIAYNLGDFFNGVKRSRDPVLQKSYAYVRDLAEEDVDVQANGTLQAIRLMLGDPAYTPPPKPPMSAADQSWVDRLVNAMTAALASHGIKAHPNWNKKT